MQVHESTLQAPIWLKEERESGRTDTLGAEMRSCIGMFGSARIRKEANDSLHISNISEAP